jgi:hypothetical protein
VALKARGKSPKKQSNKQKKRKIQHPFPENAPAPTASATSHKHPRPLDFKHTSKQEYADMLTSCQLELKAALLEINKQDKIISN